ncbi:TPA: helix-turn-helix domain-containing protein [Staphylococcus pseudintermedius]|nr:helix-turn-helix domain-containing protein [Staphylococcus pseudintermedius]
MNSGNTSANSKLFELLLKTRHEKGYSLHQASYKTGLSHSFISQLERGLRPIPIPSVLRKFANGYKLDYLYLMKLAGYITNEDNIEVQDTPYKEEQVLMFEHIEEFKKLSSEDQQKVMDILNEQADFLIHKYKKD